MLVYAYRGVLGFAFRLSLASILSQAAVRHARTVVRTSIAWGTEFWLSAQSHRFRTIIVVNYYSLDFSDAAGTAVTAALNDALAAAAAQGGATVADVFTAFQAATVPARGKTCNAGLLNASPLSEFTCDVHPSQSGQMLIGKVVAKTLAATKNRSVIQP